MSYIDSIIKSDLINILASISSGFLAAIALMLIFIFLLHTLYVLGRKQTPLYSKKPPVDGWNKRFYPASILLIILTLALAVLLRTWAVTQASVN